MKKVYFLGFIIGLLILVSCEEHSIVNPNPTISSNSRKSNNVTIDYEYGNTHYNYTGNNMVETLKFSKYNDSDSLIEIGNTIFDFNSLPFTEIKSIGSNYITYDFGDDSFTMFDIINTDTTISMNIIGPNSIQVKYYCFDRNGIPNLINTLYVGQTFGSQQKFPWVIVYAAACLIVAGVDYYCDDQVANQVAACTSQSLCSEVTSCGATCLKCPPK